jgi:hypothetical protein
MNNLVSFGSMKVGTVTFSHGREILITEHTIDHAIGFPILERREDYIEYGGDPLMLPNGHMGYVRDFHNLQ